MVSGALWGLRGVGPLTTTLCTSIKQLVLSLFFSLLNWQCRVSLVNRRDCDTLGGSVVQSLCLVCAEMSRSEISSSWGVTPDCACPSTREQKIDEKIQGQKLAQMKSNKPFSPTTLWSVALLSMCMCVTGEEFEWMIMKTMIEWVVTICIIHFYCILQGSNYHWGHWTHVIKMSVNLGGYITSNGVSIL